MALRRFTDDRAREILVAEAPKRVVSLVPSDTLTLFDLGCGGALVGRTDYCELPADGVAKIPSIGGTKNPRIDDVIALEPDLVLANQEENSRGDIETLVNKGIRTYVAFPKRVIEGLAHMAKLARIFSLEGDARVKELVKRGYDALKEAEAIRETRVPIRAFCPIWMKPLMTVHGATFISDMLDLAGASNVFADRERRYPLAADLGHAPPLPAERTADKDVRYPRVTFEEVVLRHPEIILLPDEPHPFTDEDVETFRALDVPASKRGAIVKMSGKDVCWYGSRSVEGIGRVREVVDRYRAFS